MNQQSVKFLTTRQLARLWHVSEATIKRWADAGHLNFTRTVGGHRRFTLEEVARFQSARGLGASAMAATLGVRSRVSVAEVAAPCVERGAEDDGANLFFAAIKNYDDREATALLLEAYLNGIGLATIFDEIVAPAMHRVGRLWHGGEFSVADEHLATRAVLRAIESLNISIKRRYTTGQLAVCCGVEGELHDIAVCALQVILEGESWRVFNVGGNTPFFALTEVVLKQRPALVCISSTMNHDLERGAREYRQFQEAVAECGARVVVGGEGFRDEMTRRRFPADLYANSYRELVDFMQSDLRSSGEA